MLKSEVHRGVAGVLNTVLEASNASANRANAFRAKDEALKSRDEALKAKNEALKAKDQAIKDRDAAIRTSHALRNALHTARDAAQSASRNRNQAISALKKKEHEAAKLKIELRAARDKAIKHQSTAIREGEQALAKVSSVATTDRRTLEKLLTERDAAISEKEVAIRERDRAIADLKSSTRKQSSVAATESFDKEWYKQAFKALSRDNEKLQNELFLRGEELQDKDYQAVEEMQKAQEIINIARVQAARAREEADLVAQSHAGVVSRVKSLVDERADITGCGYSRFGVAFDELRSLIAEIPKTTWVEMQETRDADDEDHQGEDEGTEPIGAMMEDGEETEGSESEDFDPERVTRQLEREQWVGYQAATQRQKSERVNLIETAGHPGSIKQEPIHLEDDLDYESTDSSDDTIHMNDMPTYPYGDRIPSKHTDTTTPTRTQAINKKQPTFVELSDTDDEDIDTSSPPALQENDGTTVHVSDTDYEDDIWSFEDDGTLRAVKRARVC